MQPTTALSQFSARPLALACTPPRTTTRNHPFRHLPPPSAVAPHLSNQITHSMQPEKLEVFRTLEPWITQKILPFLKPIDKSWQPSDLLPDPTRSDEFMDEIRALRQRTSELPDDYLVVLVGDMITEDALPTYQSWINNHDGVGDESGSSSSPWAIWNRGWSAEENRHGDLLRTYLYLSGRVDMNMIERTVHHLIGAGADVGTENNPYLGFVYTSFQERATFVSHGNTAKLAKECDPILARICGTVAADEKRHENAYVKIVEKLLELDPNYCMLAIGKMMKKKITMPAHLMYDGSDPCLFQHFSAVAQRLGVYTSHDYANILEFLIDRWGLEKIVGLKDEAKIAQDFVCGLPSKIKRLKERADERAKKLELRQVKFSWIFNKEVSVCNRVNL